MNFKEIYKNRDRLRVGDVIDYKIVSSQSIKKGEEILWDYGQDYTRDYLHSYG